MPSTLEKLVQSVQHLEQAQGNTTLALSIVKRVQREARLLSRELAVLRDKTLQSQEDTSNEHHRN